VAIPLTSESAPAAAALSDGEQLLTVALPDGDPELVALVRAAEDSALAGGRQGKRAEYRCAACGYGIVVYGRAPSCPMCRQARWEHLEWRPFSQLLEFPLADLAHSVGRSVSRLARGAPIASGQ
jgi:hypothetical protein